MKTWREKDERLKATVWRADFRHNGKRYRPRAFSRAELDKFIAAIRSNSERKKLGLDQDLPAVSVAELIAERIKELPDNQTGRQLKSILQQFAHVVGGTRPVAEITSADFRAFAVARRRANKRIQAQTINKYFGMISGTLSKSGEYFRQMDGYKPPRVPWEAVSKKPNDRTIREYEKEKILNYLREPGRYEREKEMSVRLRHLLADMFEFALLTAMRWGEIVQLTWEMLDAHQKIIYLPRQATKTGDGRTVYLNSRALEILRTRKLADAELDSALIFPNRHGAPQKRHFFYKMKDVCRRLNLPFSQTNGFTLHTTRHTSVSEILERTGDFAGAQMLAGHSDRNMTARYAHARTDKMLDLVEKLVEKKE